MTRKTIIILLIFVIIGGAIAGAFVFLNQLGTSVPGTMASFTNGTGRAAVHQDVLPGNEASDIEFTCGSTGSI